MIERDAASLREGDAASGATRRRKSPFWKQTHFTRLGRGRAFHPRCRRRYLARKEKQRKKEKEEFGYGQIGPLTKQQQEACVSASATVGAFLRYICRRDEANAKRNEEFGYGLDDWSAEQQAR